jgi:hypothetical protein
MTISEATTTTVADLVTPTWDYAPAPQARDIVTIQDRYGLFIGGDFVDPADGGSFATISPSTEDHLADVALASSADVDRAVAAARQAFGRWAADQIGYDVIFLSAALCAIAAGLWMLYRFEEPRRVAIRSTA